MTHEFLANFWALLLALMLALYVVLDGFDLGIGLLTLFTRDERHRARMMHSIGAIWDANETWLVLAGGTLFGAFPLVYGVVLNALYIPIMIMLFGLVFRAVSFEFRAHSAHKRLWENIFGLGSLAAIVGHGFTLGGLLSEIRVGPDGFAGGPWDWFNYLSVMVTVAVGFGYLMLGASYLILKADDEMQRSVRLQVTVFSILMFAMITAITVLMPFWFDLIAAKWIKAPYRSYMIALGAGAVFAFVMLLLSTRWRRYRYLPFFFSLLVFGAAFAGVLLAVYPYMVPVSITIQQAASARETLIFMLFGIAALIPAMLAYNVYLYKVFSGQLEEQVADYES